MHEKYESTNNPLQSYYCHYVIKFNIKQRIQELIDLINEKMVYPENHPYRLLRRCPNCKTIWLKVYGCKDTYCGKRLQSNEIDQVFQKQNYQEYQFEFKNEQEIQYKHIPQQDLDDTCATINQQHSQLHFPLRSSQIQNYDSDYSIIIQTREQQEKLLETSVKGLVQQNSLLETVQFQQVQEKKRVGCGNQLDWDKAEFVNIEELSLKHEKILGIFSNKDELYQTEFNYLKNKMLDKAKKEQRRL